MYVILSGAKKNLGDFLITARATALLSRFQPERELVWQPAWQPLDLELAAKARAVIILGGPGYQPKMVPGVYPLAELDRIPCPVIPLGVGWKGPAGDEQAIREYRFKDSTLQALRWMSAHTTGLGCRDWITQRVLHAHGIANAVMNGCPAWYDLDSIGTAMRLPKQVHRLVFTPAQLGLYREQSVALAATLQELFPAAERICAFHRGLSKADEWVPQGDVDNNRWIAEQVTGMGYRVEDVSGALERISFYDDCDLHVGYRVHAHIYFLSKRRPSLLLHEDGRGNGASEALTVAGVDAYQRSKPSTLASALPLKGMRKLARRMGPALLSSSNAVSRVREMLQEDCRSGFARFAGVGARIDAQFEVMSAFVKALP